MTRYMTALPATAPIILNSERRFMGIEGSVMSSLPYS
jgi:hypothetical protein